MQWVGSPFVMSSTLPPMQSESEILDTFEINELLIRVNTLAGPSRAVAVEGYLARRKELFDQMSPETQAQVIHAILAKS